MIMIWPAGGRAAAAWGCGLLLCLGSFSVSAAEGPPFAWVKVSSAPEPERPGALALDPQGNVFWARLASETNGSPPHGDFLLTKFNPAGQELWSRTEISYGLGTVVLAAADDGSVAFSKFNRWSSDGDGFGYFGIYNGLGSKLVADGGSENWALRPGRNGAFGGVARWPSGDTAFAVPYTWFSFGGRTLGSEELQMAVVVCTKTGSVRWLKTVVGPGDNMPLGALVDDDSNLYVCGYNDGLAAFDAVSVQPIGGRDGFVAKYAPDGRLLSVIRPSCTLSDSIDSMAKGRDGRIWVKGSFSGSITVGLQTLTGSGSYFAVLEPDGTFSSATKLVSGIAVSAWAPAPDGALLLCGKVSGTTFGPWTVPNLGMDDIYVASFSTAGTPIWVKTMGFIYDDTPGSVAFGPTGEIYLTGTTQGGGIFDDLFFSPAGNDDAFLAKLEAGGVPEFTAEPQTATAFRGAPVTFGCAVALGGAVTYQWFFNGTAIPGATNATYTIASATTAHQGYYFVEAANAAGSARSAVAQLILLGQLPIRVVTLSGTNVAGYLDATNGAQARFNAPNGLAHWSGGLMVLADTRNHVIRMLDSTGAVGTYAGRNLPGYADAPAGLALFSHPLGVAVEPSLDLLVADTSNNVVRRISPFGLRPVTTVAGSGIRGYLDGPVAAARFDYPNDLVVDARGNIFVTEWQNHTVRRISPLGVVSSFAGNGTPGFADGLGVAARFNQPGGIAIGSRGELYVSEWSGHRIRRIDTNGVVSTLAGTGLAGFLDGPGLAATFNQPDGLALDPLGNLYVTEAGNHAIRKIDPDGIVTTVAGLGTAGNEDGDASTARFNLPSAIAWHPAGSLFVSDYLNHSVRRIEFLPIGPSPAAAELYITLNPRLTIFGEPGSTYRIEAAEATSGTLDWTALDTVTLAGSVAFWSDPQPATRRQRFYRAVKAD